MSSPEKSPSKTPNSRRDQKRLASRNQQQASLRKAGLPGAGTPADSQTAAFRHHWILWVGPIVMLVAALLPWPYGYYNFLRICVCGAAAFLAYQQWTHDNAASKWVVVLAAIGVLYNPLVPIHLTREIWSVLNVATAAAFVGHLRSLQFILRETSERTQRIGRERRRAVIHRRR